MHKPLKQPRFCTWYVNRWGQVMVAAKYGYKAWRFSK
jgi:hypothetical protein